MRRSSSILLIFAVAAASLLEARPTQAAPDALAPMRSAFQDAYNQMRQPGANSSQLFSQVAPTLGAYHEGLRAFAEQKYKEARKDPAARSSAGAKPLPSPGAPASGKTAPVAGKPASPDKGPIMNPKDVPAELEFGKPANQGSENPLDAGDP